MVEVCRFLKFIFFSIIACFIEILIMRIFLHFFSVSIIIEKIISILVFAFLNFKLNKIFTFESDVESFNSIFRLFIFYIIFELIRLLYFKVLNETIINNTLFIIINIVLDYLYQKYYIFKGHIDNNRVKIKM